ncbi:hypothetical protein BVRB_1g017250 [Beta vulgaris subsp. vulgaris]|nr:hypothetical protein BVRB_1g017250 [Beta vulgaris subsp. vulgaris]
MVRRKLNNNNNDVTSSGNDVSPNILITVLILAIAVILSASLYLLLRFLRRNRTTNNNNGEEVEEGVVHHHSLSSTSANGRRINRRISPTNNNNNNNNPLIDALPLFPFDSLKSTAGDCAVCLSKFEQKDLLRLLPICCHVFHADCIDTWLNSNQSCPLCRSPVFVPDSELFTKVLNNNNNNNNVNNNNNENESSNSLSSDSRSFRVEIGNVSQRNSGEFPVRRSYSLGGNFDYIVVDDDVVSEIHSGSFRRTTSSAEFKNDVEQLQQQQQGVLAAEIGPRGGGGWLKEYLTHSLSSSFRSSGRWFFTGSSRRETAESGGENRVSELDLEASRLGDEIGELFRWLSGV